MGSRHIIKQFLYRLSISKHTGGAEGLIFSFVQLSDGFKKESLGDMRFPAAIVIITGNRPDEEHPEFSILSFEVNLLIASRSDAFGEGAIIGKHFTANDGTSDGKGLFQIYKAMAEASMFQGMAPEGLIYWKSLRQNQMVEIIDQDTRIHRLRCGYECFLFERQTFISPSSGSATENSGDVDLAFKIPDRWDLLSTSIIRKSGSAPTSISDGTAVTSISKVSGETDYTYTDPAPGSGTWFYGLFGNYDIDEDGVTDNNSGLLVLEVTV